jgi:hypothetical protein
MHKILRVGAGENESRACASKKKNLSPLLHRPRKSHVVSWAGAKCRMRHHMNLPWLAAAGKASSKSSQISEIASGARARNDSDTRRNADRGRFRSEK